MVFLSKPKEQQEQQPQEKRKKKKGSEKDNKKKRGSKGILKGEEKTRKKTEILRSPYPFSPGKTQSPRGTSSNLAASFLSDLIKLERNKPILDWLESACHIFVCYSGEYFMCHCSAIEATEKKGTEKLSEMPNLLNEENTAQNIAQQITNYHYTLFGMVSSRELLRWVTSKNKGVDCPNLTGLVDHFNNIAHWVTASIVTCVKMEDRKNVIIKVIEVMNLCLGLRNYLAVKALCSALRHTCVARMKKTWAVVGTGPEKDMAHCDSIMSHTANYAAYRQLLSTAPPPRIPFLGCVSKDLLFCHDGNQDYYEDQLNMNKIRKMAELVLEFGRGKNIPYLEFQYLIPGDQWNLKGFQPLTEKELMYWSKLVEPENFEVMLIQLLGEMQKTEAKVAVSAIEIAHLKKRMAEMEEKEK
mmetsp:Transcript_5148/g.7719  ORF Transcript_5148/g.7719 Transcript_5148/m.7719 type:complete len:413 (-) Transcript_5148:28-1266(-)